jgi:phospholipid/cholesterol/gamma-HCH transport system substrate-binding protein
MHEGTVARINENSLSGIANRYIVLEPGPTQSPAIPSGGLVPLSNTYSFVSLDQLFNTLNAPTRQGLRNFIRGQAASIEGRAPQAHRTLRYFAPALASTSNFTQELVRNEPAFDGLLVQGAQAMQRLASASGQLTQLVANGNAATGAIASQAVALERALSLFPGTLNGSTTTFKGLDSTIQVLNPLVVKAKVAVRRLAPFASLFHQLLNVSIPTVANLNSLIRNPSGNGDLISLLQETPSLARVAVRAFPQLIREMNVSQAQLNYLREYTPDVVAALSNIGQTAAYFDANGHYARTQPTFFAFGRNASNQLTSKPPYERYKGLQVVKSRCPGGAVQPAPDGSSPWAVPGCSTNSTPPGP